MNISGENITISNCGGTRISLVTMSHYDSAWDLLTDETVLPDLSEDFQEWVQGSDDFEPIAYFCLNREIVVVADSISGDIISICQLDDFLAKLQEEYSNSET